MLAAVRGEGLANVYVPECPRSAPVLPRDDEDEFHHLNHGKQFYEDVHGKPLERELVINAREFDVELLKRMEVYTKVCRSVVWMLGTNVITTK